MQLRNSESTYGAVAILLHWTVAVGVVAMLVTAGGVWFSPNDEMASQWMQIHGAIGVLIWLLIAARIIWHFIDRRPDPLSSHAGLNKIARFVHVALLFLIAAQLLTGPIDIWSGGWPIGVFGWFAIPSPIGDSLKAWHDPIGAVHRYTGYAIALILTLHVAAALKHLLINRDRTVQRMLGLSADEAENQFGEAVEVDVERQLI